MSNNNHPDNHNDKDEDQARQTEADKAKQDQELNDTDLDNVSGGLPAVQKVREAAARLSSSLDK
jgi:hypothetical protein